MRKESLRDHRWEVSYSTSDLREDGSPVHILHDFYIPALSRATRYDRVAGYFSSSSLAAASQGFTRFVENGGHARFIVGVDLDPEDARAILGGEEARAAARLNECLGTETDWPNGVRNGVHLLAWMVAHGYLTVKVAVRVHGQSGDPRCLDYRGDGYVHEKWALFQDAFGDGLVASGSLNESRTALEINAENLEIAQTWEGRGQESFDKKARSFEAMWSDSHPWIRTFDLPEAVQRRLVNLAGNPWRLLEIDGTPGPPLTQVQDKPDHSPSPQEKLRFALLRLGPLLPGGEYVGVETAPITPWPHQRFVTQRVIGSFPENHLLCDEVGLGKTIEAGLVFRSLWLAGRVRSIRVFAPASLTSQWLHEMAEKFLLPFRRRLNHQGTAEEVDPETGQVARSGGALFDSDLEIISTGLLSRRDGQHLLRRMPETDLVLVDEAHKARRRNPDATNREPSFNHLYQALDQGLAPRARSLLLATATPMQLNRVEAFDLLRFMPSAGAVRYSDVLSSLFYELRERLLQGDTLADYERKWLARYLRDARASAPEQWAFVHDWVVDSFYQLDLEGLVERGDAPFSWEELQPALTLLAPLGRSMLRHNRGLLREYQQAGELGANLARRQVHAHVVAMGSAEQAIYDRLQGYCQELAARIATNMPESKQRAAVGFYLSFLRQRLASSFHALAESLERRLEKIRRTMRRKENLEIAWKSEEELEHLAEEEAETLVLKNRENADLVWEEGAVVGLLDSLGQLSGLPEKTKTLLKIIEGRREMNSSRVRQVVVFTRYGDTMAYLLDLLSRRLPECPLGTFSGEGGRVRWAAGQEQEGQDRTAIKRLFLNGAIDILLCTDAAAEGLNLQCADLLVNFDLPWNPMLLEQRIGRIDRIGQQFEQIHVRNLMYQGTVEEVVYDRLVKRFKRNMEVTGELQFSLLPIKQSDFEDFAKSSQEKDKISEEELIERAKEEERRLNERKEITEFKPAEQKKVYEALSRQAEGNPAPVTLSAIWQTLTESAYLKELGCVVQAYPEGQVFRIRGVPGVPDEPLLTVDPDLYERGLASAGLERLLFATYGEPVFERVVNTVLKGEASVVEAWHQRRPLQGIRCASGHLFSQWWDAATSSERVGEGQLTPIAAEASHGQRRETRQVGRLQQRALLIAAATLADEKLSDKPSSPAVQVQNLERFRKSREREASPVFKQPLSLTDRSDLLARKEMLLWPVQEHGQDVAVQADPLLIRAAATLVERQLQGMKRENRTGSEVARQLRNRAASLQRAQ